MKEGYNITPPTTKVDDKIGKELTDLAGCKGQYWVRIDKNILPAIENLTGMIITSDGWTIIALPNSINNGSIDLLGRRILDACYEEDLNE